MNFDAWAGPASDVLVSTVAQVIPIFLLAMAADAIATRFEVSRPSTRLQTLLYLNIGQLTLSEFYVVSMLATPQSDRGPAWLPLLDLAIALVFSYFVQLLRWRSKLVRAEIKEHAKSPKRAAAKKKRKR